MTNCLECGAPLTGPFCALCGQKAGPRRRPLLSLLSEFFAETFSLDGRFLRTVAPLATKPGFLTREYNEGRRTRFTSPIKLYLLATFLLFLTFSVRGCIEAVSVAPEVDLTAAPEPSAMQISGLHELPQDRPFFRRLAARLELANRDRTYWDSVRESWIETLPTTLFFLLPLFAFLCWLCLLGNGLYFVEAFVFTLHAYAFTFLYLTVEAVIPDFAGSPLLLIGIPIYFVIALARSFRLRWYSALLRSVVLAAIFAPICLVVGLAGLAIAAGMG